MRVLDLHILPRLGKIRVRDLDRGRIKIFLASKLASGLSRNSVRIIHATLRSMLNAAVDDRLILANPAERLGRQLRLLPSKTARQEAVKAFNRDQVIAFLAGVEKADPLYSPLFLTLARTGMRIGEALALQWDDIDFAGREVRVSRAFSDGELSTPKSGHGRSIDLSRQLGETLSRLRTARKVETLKKEWSSMPPWVFCTARGTVIDQANVRRALKRSLTKAKLPGHFTVHSLRHTFASLLLQQGESPAYVQRQLGHASIQLTVDTYGKWLPMGNKAAVDQLDDDLPETSGSKVVAEARFGGGSASSENPQGAGFSCRNEESWRADLNRRPADYESAALPTELRQHDNCNSRFQIPGPKVCCAPGWNGKFLAGGGARVNDGGAAPTPEGFVSSSCFSPRLGVSARGSSLL
jgi:integrase